MNLDELQEIQRYIAQCDPEKPLTSPDDPRYEPLDQGDPVRGSSKRSAVEELAHTIYMREPAGTTCQIFTGFSGSGKTTELRRLAATLAADKLVPTHVVFVEFERFIDLYSPISITDVLRVLAYALDREATIEESIASGKLVDHDTIEVRYLRQLFEIVAGFDAQLKTIGFDAYGAKLMLEIKNNPSFRQRVEDALKLRFQVFADEATVMMSEAIVRLRKATRAQRVVVIADGLEKLTYVREEDRERAESAAETVFVTHASWLRLPVHVIYTFPFWLRFRAPGLGALYHSEPRVLPMVKIAERGGGDYQRGFDKLAHLVGRRMPLARVFGPDLDTTLHALVAASGGYPRDLLRLVRDALSYTSSLPVSPADCEYVVNRLAEAYERVIRTPDVELLVEIGRTNVLPKGDKARMAALGRLFDRWLVLAYVNGKEWYDLHPLVRLAPEVKEGLSGGR